MTQWVSDAVWAQLDPHSGALPSGQRNRITAFATTAAVLFVACFVLDRSGVLWSHVAFAADAGPSAANSVVISTDSKIVNERIAVENTGWTTVRVLGVGRGGPGLRLLGPTEAGALPAPWNLAGTTAPFDLHPGQIAMLAVTYQVTDCRAVPTGSFPVPVRLDRAWGTQTIDIFLPPSPGDSAGAASSTTEPLVVEWQRAMADKACGAQG